jgi:hypothetical protein
MASKRRRVLLIVLAVIVLIVGGVGVWFLQYSWQPKLKSYDINTPQAAKRVLIASQGRKHKTDTLAAVTDYYTGKDVYIRVIDVSGLPDVQADEWDFIVLFSAIRMYKLNPDAQAFLDRIGESAYKRVLLFNTSDGTQMGYDGVDAVTSASVKPQDSANTIITAIERAQAEIGRLL